MWDGFRGHERGTLCSLCPALSELLVRAPVPLHAPADRRIFVSDSSAVLRVSGVHSCDECYSGWGLNMLTMKRWPQKPKLCQTCLKVDVEKLWNLSRSQSSDAMRCDTCEVHCARVGRVVLEIDSCRSMTHWEISRRWRSSQKWRCFSLYCLHVVIFVVDVVGCGLLPQVEACQRYETEGWKLPQVQRGPTKMHRMPGPKLRINYDNPIRTGDWM